MKATLPLQQTHDISPKIVSPLSAAATPSSAGAHEIHSYLAVRDLLLAEAEQNGTEASLQRARIANEFAETCLRSPRSPYEAQYLAETDAARERHRCKGVKLRIAELRARIGAKNYARPRAA
jgi:hypothetical protein